MDLISVIIPVYNSEKTIERCIKSVVGQTYDNIEILVIDGVSRDSTLQIIEKISKEYKSIKLVSEPDQGVYDAMNKGISIAKGEWLYFLGSDDYFLNDNVLHSVFFEKVNSDFDFLYGNVNSPDLGPNYDGPFDDLKLTNKNICHQAIFYRKNVFNLLGNYSLLYPICADHEFNFRCFFNPKVKKKFIDINIAFYAPGGLSRKVRDYKFESDKSRIIFREKLRYATILNKPGLIVQRMKILMYKRAPQFLKNGFIKLKQ